MANEELVLLPSLTAAQNKDGTISLTKKFVSGVQQFQAHWPGPVRVVIEPDAEQSNNLDNVSLDPKALPFQLDIVDYDEDLGAKLRGAAVALGTVGHRQNHVSRVARDVDVPIVYTTEYTLGTRVQIVEAETNNPVLRLRRSTWAWRQEQRQLRAMRESAGVQANGTPTYEAYRTVHPNTLLYFDTRTTADMIIDNATLDAKLARSRDKPLRLAFSGRMDPMKGVDHLPLIAAELVARGVDFTMSIFGGGSLADSVRRDLSRLSLDDRVRLEGVVDFETELVPRLRADFDLFVCPHVQGDPSCTYMETFACGVPIVGFANEAFSGLLRIADVGWSTPIGDVEAVADRIAQLDRDRDEVVSKCHAARQLASLHTFEATFDRRMEHLQKSQRRPATSGVAISAEAPALPTVSLLDMPLARIDRWELLDHIFSALDEGRGGWLLTANLDFLRRWHRDPWARSLYGAADIVVADGMPLVWAAQLMGDPLPERVAGSSMIWLFAERAAKGGRSIYMLGGEPSAAAAAQVTLQTRWPDLKIAGRSSPMISNPPTDDELDGIRADLEAAKPDLVMVGFGSPKQELVIERLRTSFPSTWMMGVGISFSFVAGHVRRAPPWAQKAGLEWVHRLAQEPRRLARRYLVDDLPFAAQMFARAWRDRK